MLQPKFILTIALALGVTLVSACSPRPKTVLLGGATMGTSWSLKLIAVNSPLSSVDLQREVAAELEDVEARMSNWRETSEVSVFNRAERCAPVSPETQYVVEAALNLSKMTGGAFDITVSPLIERWGFGTDFTGDDIPAQAELDRLMAEIGYQHLQSLPGQLCKTLPQLSINLSAIAKGYAVDRVAQRLDTLGYQNYLVEVGGELFAKGHRADHQLWRIGVEQPVSSERSILENVALPLDNEAVATSGDYRNFFEKDGVRYSHIIDPMTGRPAAHDVASVTVIADSTMQADAWATSLLVLGVEQGMVLADKYGLKVLMISYSNEQFSRHTSASWD